MNNMTQRDAFWNKVYEIALKNKDIIVISADMGASALDNFRRDLPSHFVNVGIAEQNGILIATGLTLSGKKVFVYAIAPFITLRCLEQIRVNNAIMKIPLTLVGVGAGFGYDDSGPTHHITEDIAILRAMPHITIHSVTDSVMASAIAEISCKMKMPNYVRLDRGVFPNLYDRNSDFTEGLCVLKESKDYYIVSTGCMTHAALDIADKLKRKKINVGVIDVYTLPINVSLFLKIIKGAKKLITLEEHFLSGGFGSLVCEVLNDNDLLIPVKRIGLPIDRGYCYKYGGREIIRSYYGVDKESMERQIIEFLA
ncbi:MAG: transketolase C-terminal domain-containing protein [bacterium]